MSRQWAHGDAARVADLAAERGCPLVPWQRELLEQIEASSMDEQFAEIVKQLR